MQTQEQTHATAPKICGVVRAGWSGMCEQRYVNATSHQGRNVRTRHTRKHTIQARAYTRACGAYGLTGSYRCGTHKNDGAACRRGCLQCCDARNFCLRHATCDVRPTIESNRYYVVRRKALATFFEFRTGLRAKYCKITVYLNFWI